MNLKNMYSIPLGLDYHTLQRGNHWWGCQNTAVEQETNHVYYKLIKSFMKATNCPILVNTSFNVRGEPIVCTPIDAFNCFMGTELDLLIIGNFILKKKSQEKTLLMNYKNKYELD